MESTACQDGVSSFFIVVDDLTVVRRVLKERGEVVSAIHGCHEVRGPRRPVKGGVETIGLHRDNDRTPLVVRLRCHEDQGLRASFCFQHHRRVLQELRQTAHLFLGQLMVVLVDDLSIAVFPAAQHLADVLLRHHHSVIPVAQLTHEVRGLRHNVEIAVRRQILGLPVHTRDCELVELVLGHQLHLVGEGHVPDIGEGVPLPRFRDLLDLALLVRLGLVIVRELGELADVLLGVGGILVDLLPDHLCRIAVVDEEDHIGFSVMPALLRVFRVEPHPRHGDEAQLRILRGQIVRCIGGIAVQLRAAVFQGGQQQILDDTFLPGYRVVIEDCGDIAVALHRYAIAAVLAHKALHLGKLHGVVEVHHFSVGVVLDGGTQGSCEQVGFGIGLQSSSIRYSQIFASGIPSLRQCSTSIRVNRSASHRSSISSSDLPSSARLIAASFGVTVIIFSYLLGEISSFIMGVQVQPVNIPSFVEGEFRQIIGGRIFVLVRALPPLPLLAGSGLILLVDVGLHIGMERPVSPPVVFIPLLVIGVAQHRLSRPAQPRHLLKGLVPELPILGVRGVLNDLNTSRRCQYTAIFGDRIPGSTVLLPLPLCRLQRLLQALAQGLQGGLGLCQGTDILALPEAGEEPVDLRLRLLQDRGGPARQTVQGPLMLEGRPHQVSRQLLVHVGVEVLLRLLLLPYGTVELRQGFPVGVDAVVGVLEVAALLQGAEGGEDVRRQGAVGGCCGVGQLMAQSPVHGPGGVHLVAVEGQNAILDAGVGLGKESLRIIDHPNLLDTVALGEDRLYPLRSALQLPASRGLPGLLNRLLQTLTPLSGFPGCLPLFLTEGKLLYTCVALSVCLLERLEKRLDFRVRSVLVAGHLPDSAPELVQAHPTLSFHASIHRACVLQILLISQSHVRLAGLRESVPIGLGEILIAYQRLPITTDLTHGLCHDLTGPVPSPFGVRDGLAAQGEAILRGRGLSGGDFRCRDIDGGFRLGRLGNLCLLELGRHLCRLLLLDLGSAPVDGIQFLIGDLFHRELDPSDLREERLGLGVGGVDLVDLLHVQLLSVHKALNDACPELGRLQIDPLGLHDPGHRVADHRCVRVHLLNCPYLLLLRDSASLGDLHLRLQCGQGFRPDETGFRPVTRSEEHELRDVLVVRLHRTIRKRAELLLVGLKETPHLCIGDLPAGGPLTLQLLRQLSGLTAQDPAGLEGSVLRGLGPVGDIGAEGLAPSDLNAMVHGLIHRKGSAAQHDGDPAALVTGLLDSLLLLLGEPAGQEVPVDIPGASGQSFLPVSGGAVQHPVLIRHGDGLLGLFLHTLSQNVQGVAGADEPQNLHQSLCGLVRSQLSGQRLRPTLGHCVQQLTATQGQDINSCVTHLDHGGDQGLVVGSVPGLLFREAQVQEGLEGRAPHGVIAVFTAGGNHTGLNAVGKASRVADAGNRRANCETGGAAQKTALDLRLGLVEELGQVVGEALTEPRGDLPLLIQDAAVLVHILTKQLSDGFRVGPVLRCGVVQIVVPGQALVLGKSANVVVGGELALEGILLLAHSGLLQDIELPAQARLLRHGLLVALDRLLVGGRLGSAHGPCAHAASRLDDLVARLLDLLLGRLLPLPGLLLHGGLVRLQRRIRDARPQAGESAGDPGGAVQLALGLLLRGVGAVLPLGVRDQLRPSLRLLVVRPGIRFQGKRHRIRGALLLGGSGLHNGNLIRLSFGSGLGRKRCPGHLAEGRSVTHLDKTALFARCHGILDRPLLFLLLDLYERTHIIPPDRKDRIRPGAFEPSPSESHSALTTFSPNRSGRLLYGPVAEKSAYCSCLR